MRYPTLKAAILIGGLILLPLGLAADENVDIWSQIYYETRSDAGRYQIALKILELRNRDFIPMLEKALDDLYYRRIDSGTTTERYDRLQLARLLVQNLGSLNASEASDRVFAIYNELADPFLKSDCAVALGKFRAKSYAYRFARDLGDINLAGNQGDTRPQEVLAFGLVQALESLRDPGSFQSLFLATIAWYPNTSRVKEIARNALLKLFEDPSEQFVQLIERYPEIRVKLAGLEAEIASKASPAGKAAVARTALRQGLALFPSLPSEINAQKRLRTLAIEQLVANGDKDPDAARMLIELIGRDKFNESTFDDTLMAYTALGHNASAPAVAYLNARLDGYNQAQRSGKNTPRDKILVREIVDAIKRAKDPSSYAILFKSQYVDDYDANILADIKAALAVVPKPQ